MSEVGTLLNHCTKLPAAGNELRQVNVGSSSSSNCISVISDQVPGMGLTKELRRHLRLHRSLEQSPIFCQLVPFGTLSDRPGIPPSMPTGIVWTRSHMQVGGHSM